MLADIRAHWQASKTFRVLTILAIVYAVVRMAAQAVLLTDMASAPDGQLASDLQIYINAAQHFAARDDLYLKGSLAQLEAHYPYSPAFALIFMPILLLPLAVLIPLDVLLHVGAYVLMYVYWGRIFKRLKLTGAAQMLVRLLPLWIVATPFWDDVSYLNIYILMVAVGTLFINAVLEENLGWAIFWLGIIILPIKPHWAFAAVLPLLLGHYKFFARLIGGALIAYLLLAGATLLIGGIQYGLGQYADYIAFLSRLSRDFPWRTPADPFLGYNHSLMQTVFYYFGISPLSMKAVSVLKLILLAPLGGVGLRLLARPLNQRGDDVPRLALDLAFALYLAAFIWLDMVWEISLGMAVFTYLIGTLANKKVIRFLWVAFLPYALADVWRLLSYIIFGDSILYADAYVLTDPLIYLPWIMFALVAFYAILIQRLYQAPAGASQ